MEILRQHARPIDAVFVPVGGGGLISGIAAYVKRLRPSVQHDRRRAGRRRRHGAVAEGGAARDARPRGPVRRRRRGEAGGRGDLPPRAGELVDEMVLVDTDEICAAIKDVFEDTRVVLEPAGALAVAGAKAWVERSGVRGKTLVAIASRRQHQLRPPALRRRARRGGRAARGGARGHDPRAPRQLPPLLRDARRAQHHRVQLPHGGLRGRRTSSSASAVHGPRGDRRASCAACARAGCRRSTCPTTRWRSAHVRHMVGGRARLGEGTSCCTASSSPSARAR